jgi:hypothetical protein
MDSWIKSGDQKPVVNIEVLAASYNGIWFYNLTLWDGEVWRTTYENLTCSVDYWMPLPNPPSSPSSASYLEWNK